MLNLDSDFETIGGYKVRNVKLQIGSDCKCSLNQSYIIGEIQISEQWHPTKWNLDGSNLSGVEKWHLINISNATPSDSETV